MTFECKGPAQKVRDHAQIADKGWYNIIPVNPIFDNNCATFAVGAVKAAGIGVDMPENGFIPWLLPVRTGLFCELNPELCELWDRAKKWLWPRDPIILDLDGNGLETVGLAANIHFDHDGDGVLTRTGWAGKEDALLVWDRNANGSIDTGAELFGDFTPLPNGTLAPNGFAALAALDSNGDGILDASDPAFAELKLWRDADQNGVTGAGELISLADAGILSLIDSFIEAMPQTASMIALLDEFGVRRLGSGNDSTWLSEQPDIGLAGTGNDWLHGQVANTAWRKVA